jgi:hypothetical protein
MERLSSFVIGDLESLLELEQIDTIVFWAWTCKTILEICTKECEDRLLTLLPTLNPNNTNLILYKSYIQKWYHYRRSLIPLRWTLSLLLRCPVERKIQWVNLLPNTTLPCPKRRALWLYKTSINEQTLRTPDNEIHTLTLCDYPDSVNFDSILAIFPSLIKLKVIRTTLIRSFVINPPIFNLVALSIIECDITKFDLNNWMLRFTKLQKLKLKQNTWNNHMAPRVNLTSSIKSVFIIHPEPKSLIINTTNCGREVFIK